jgi:hypothetical protein
MVLSTNKKEQAMSTRGCLGVATGGKLYLAYCHSDSYPSWLGVRVAGFCEAVRRLGKWKELAQAYSQVTLVQNSDPVPPAARQFYAFDAGVNGGDKNTWYCWLRAFQGIEGMRAVLRGTCRHIEDHSAFPEDSLFCEWAYVVDLDKGVLEVYKGFQSKPHTKGRFATATPEQHASGDTYYPCKLIKSVKLATITRHSLDALARKN